MISPYFLSASDRRELIVCVCSHREDHGVARHESAILLLDNGKPYQAIAEALCLDGKTIRAWLDERLLNNLGQKAATQKRTEFRDKVADNFRDISHDQFRAST
jgi:DNA-binding NarL/FixJ family response regulator